MAGIPIPWRLQITAREEWESEQLRGGREILIHQLDKVALAFVFGRQRLELLDKVLLQRLVIPSDCSSLRSTETAFS